jgi:hypothetical protein
MSLKIWRGNQSGKTGDEIVEQIAQEIESYQTINIIFFSC